MKKNILNHQPRNSRVNMYSFRADKDVHEALKYAHKQLRWSKADIINEMLRAGVGGFWDGIKKHATDLKDTAAVFPMKFENGDFGGDGDGDGDGHPQKQPTKKTR